MGFVSFFVGVYYYIVSIFSVIYLLHYPIIRYLYGKFSKKQINAADPFNGIVTPYKHIQEKKRPLYATAAVSATVVKNNNNNNTNNNNNSALVIPGLVSEVVEEGVPSSSNPVPFNLSLPLSSFSFITDPNYNHNQPIIPFIQKSLITNDGAVINYYILYPGNPRTMVFANGLGIKSSFQSFAPLLKQYAGTDGDWTFITWDYRGLFHPNSLYPPNHLSPHYHCEDLSEILSEENISKIDCFVGYSFGGQIALQMALSYPNKINKLLLINSTYGKIFNNLYQPLFRIPYASDIIQSVINVLITYPLLIKIGLFFYKPLAKIYSFFYNIYYGSPYFRSSIGTNYLYDYSINDLLSNYYSYIDIINYLQLLQEFDNHSVYHLLKYIHQPTMIISGLLNIYIPTYQSFDIASLIPNSKLIIIPAAGHNVLLESPDKSLIAIKELIESDHDWMKKYTGPTEEEKKKILKGVVKEVVEKIEQKQETNDNNINNNNNNNTTASTTSSTGAAAGGKKKNKNKNNNNNNNKVGKVHAIEKEGESLGESWTEVSGGSK